MNTTVTGLLLVTLAGGGSYLRLTEAREAQFYRTGGRASLGARLHLHLPPTPFVGPPRKVRPSARGPTFHQYIYRKVKFLVHPKNPYYQQFRRKRKEGQIVCLKGRVVLFAGKTGPAVLIHRIRTLPPRRRQ